MIAGLVDADLGGGLLKKRWIFLAGYAKAEREDLDPDELAALRLMGRTLLSLSDERLARAIEAGEIEEMTHDDQAQPDPS